MNELLGAFKRGGPDDRERFFQALLLAAARFDLYVAGGERDARLVAAAQPGSRRAQGNVPAPACRPKNSSRRATPSCSRCRRLRPDSVLIFAGGSAR